METQATQKQLDFLMSKFNYSQPSVETLSKEQASKLLDACVRLDRKLTPDEMTGIIVKEKKEASLAIIENGTIEPCLNDTALNALFADLSAEAKEDELSLRRDLKAVAKLVQVAAFELGRVLTGYKASLPHGKWYPFLETIGIPVRAAQRYTELFKLRDGAGHSMIKLAETKGFSLPSSGYKTQAKEVARDLNAWAEKRIAEKNAEEPDREIPHGLTLEDQAEGVEEVLAKHAQVEAVQEVKCDKSVAFDKPEDLKQRQTMFSGRLLEDFLGLRGAYRDDTAFRAECRRLFEQAISAPTPWASKTSSVNFAELFGGSNVAV
jgi:hypothetical protein